jgi:hypothetical protein
MDDWAKRRLAELHAAAPVKRKKTEPPFVKVPLWWAAEAAKATDTVKVIVWIELLHRSWKTKRATVSLPNGKLEKAGVSRFVKYRVLRKLEAAGLITFEWRCGKNPLVTLIVL